MIHNLKCKDEEIKKEKEEIEFIIIKLEYRNILDNFS
jgi:hypothetical protein